MALGWARILGLTVVLSRPDLDHSANFPNRSETRTGNRLMEPEIPTYTTRSVKNAVGDAAYLLNMATSGNQSSKRQRPQRMKLADNT